VCLCDADVSQQDSGNYTCEVRGPQSTLLGHVTHYLFVRGLARHQWPLARSDDVFKVFDKCLK